jgi:hypothetical protein
MECAGSVTLNFYDLSWVYSNLGGHGPDMQPDMCLEHGTMTGCSAGAPNAIAGGCCLRYYDVGELIGGQKIDLVVQTLDDTYSPRVVEKNGVEPQYRQYGQINFGDKVETQFKFQLAYPNTSTPVESLEALKWTFLDMDSAAKDDNVKLGERMRIKSELVSEYYTSETNSGTDSFVDSQLTIETEGDYMVITGRTGGTVNPEHPQGLTEAQQQVAIGFLFEEKSGFDIFFELFGSTKKADGRNIFFTGASLQTEQCSLLNGDDLPVEEVARTQRIEMASTHNLDERIGDAACMLSKEEVAEVKQLYSFKSAK